MRGDASIFSAIVLAIVFFIALSTIYSYISGLRSYQVSLYSSLSSIASNIGASVEFIRGGSAISIYSDRELGVLGVFVYSSNGLIYYNISSGGPIAYTSPGSPLDISAIVPGWALALVLGGEAYLGVLMSNGVLYTYRYSGGDAGQGGGSVSGDIWASPLLAIARSMSDIVYSSPGVYWFSGDEASGSVRATLARTLSIGEGVTLYIADPTPRYVYVSTYPGGNILYRIESAGGVGVTRFIVADTIVINGTLTSRGLGGAGNILYTYYYPGQPQVCGTEISVLGDLANRGAVASAGGRGTGAKLQNVAGDLYCRGLAGGSATLYGYSVSGGRQGGLYGGREAGYPGSTIDYRALIRASMLSPYQLAETPLYGAGGGSGGPGSAGLYQWSSGGPGGRGGGGIVILCNRLIMNNGVIDASGEDGGESGSPNGGGGGGGGAGSIFIYCNSIEGTGVIRVLGGSGGPGSGIGMPGGSGGDGWVVIVASSISPGIVVDVGRGHKVVSILSS